MKIFVPSLLIYSTIYDICHAERLSSTTSFVPPTPLAFRKSKDRLKRTKLEGDEASSPQDIELPPIASHFAAKRLQRLQVQPRTLLARLLLLTTLACVGLWGALEFEAVTHGLPSVGSVSLTHLVLNVGQAVSVPGALLLASGVALSHGLSRPSSYVDAVVYRRLLLTLTVVCGYVAVSLSVNPSFFSFGLDPFSPVVLKTAIGCFGATACICLYSWFSLVAVVEAKFHKLVNRLFHGPLTSLALLLYDLANDFPKQRGFLALSAIGFVGLTFHPLVRSFPIATIPSGLGKALARPAAAFSLLAAVVLHCLGNCISNKEASYVTPLKNGIAWGCCWHVVLLLLKLVGIDGGGLLLSGDGLQTTYTSMMKVPIALGAQMGFYLLVFVACVRF